MKYNDIVQIVSTIEKFIDAPISIANTLGKSEALKSANDPYSNNSINNDTIYAEPENSNIEYNKSVPMEDNKSYNNNDNERNDYYNKQGTSSNSQGVIDSIAQELTSARLQQAIILSEIVGKPRSKTRKKRRF